MRSTGTSLRPAILLILLSATAGLLLLLLGRGPLPERAAPPSPSATGEPSPTATSLPTIPPPSPTPGPLLHTVQAGETLAGIAAAYGVPLAELIAVNHIQDPNLIRVGQVLVIPGAWATPAPTASLPPSPPSGPTSTPFPRPTLPVLAASGPPGVEIAGVLGAGDLARERVRLRNRGEVVSLEGWSLSDAGGDRYTFPRLVLFPGGEVTLHSGSGASGPTQLYWNRAAPAWQSGELLTLRDADGAVVDTYVVP
ncbi:MAG: LysM peptidoglycan-binding domain-containing protein [Anaerolineae bacterium]|nr:LysM peptidoglycan-binding domain-containing protein [Anaerolineae bacterium]MDW8067513.1 LysM peptidoglycan-binding domain-containing protein [Anaerolineae bacterium]